ncbi:MAG: glycerol uptake operon antiterminator [Thermotogaceae bacterium]|jgi:glycerol-3-phosphate responsive antiterminator|nr:glycerol uptake operon antiterminator [Thermotogaceae bacterium]
MKSYNISSIIAAVWNPKEELEYLDAYSGNTVFLLSSDLVNLGNHIKKIKKKGFKVFLDIDFCDGLGNGEYAFRYSTLQGADGIITVKPKMIDIANSYGVPNVLRSFALDSNSLLRINEMITNINPMFLEILPGSAFPNVFYYLKSNGLKTDNMIAAGLIETKKETEELFKCGAKAISTSKTQLW